MNQADDSGGARLDRTLVLRGHFATRARARDAILRGTVTVDGQTVTKPAHECTDTTDIAVSDPASPYVSRAALKLKAALAAFDIPVSEAVCLDIGASTGGFTQVLLEAGAARVHAIDVGHGQMDRDLAKDRRVRLTEGLNARNLSSDDLDGDRPSVIVSDVSFISLKLALPAALDLAAPVAQLVALVKPQFEVGRDRIGKGGLVAANDGRDAANAIGDWLDGQAGWSREALIASPITGGDGNVEYLLWGTRDG